MADTTRFDYRYPLAKLTSSDDYLKITVLEYKPPGFGSSSNTFALPTAGEVSGYNISDEKGTIILPIPDTVQDTNGVDWGMSTFNPIEALAARGIQGLFSKGDASSKLNAAQVEVGKIVNAAQTGYSQKFFQALGINAASNVLFSNDKRLGETLSRYSGQIVNSNVELIFSSVKLRQPFAFGFDITPRSEREAAQVKDIIKKLKSHSAAKKSSDAAAGLFLKAPEVFKLEYMNGSNPHPYLHKFKICALENISVNYTGSGTYATYSDATPVHMTLNLTFQELTPIYAEDYTDDLGGTGY
jgi:hypothetical protein